MAIPIDPQLLAPNFLTAQQSNSSPLQDLTSRSFTIPLPQKEETTVENADEWEYEYSTTETDTYYLTLDLTPPNDPSTQLKKSSTRGRGGRGGYKQYWHSPHNPKRKGALYGGGTVSVSVDRVRKASEAASTPAVDDDDNTPMGDIPEEDEDEGEEAAEETPGVSPSEPKSKPKEPEQIQILDLHTSNPIISYKEHVFTCHWANNIGTELLFTTHDEQNPLPALRALPDSLDLLAASTARIVSSSAKLVPRSTSPIINPPSTEPPTSSRGKGKGRPRSRGRSGRGRQTTKGQPQPPPEENKYIYTGKLTSSMPSPSSTAPSTSTRTSYQASQQNPTHRYQQASFLERLASVKHARGEDDAVTINTVKRLRASEWKARVAGHKDGGKPGAGARPGRLQVRVRALENLNRNLNTDSGARSRGRGRGAGSGGSRRDTGDSPYSLSIPTPSRWHDPTGSDHGTGSGLELEKGTQMDGSGETEDEAFFEEGFSDEEEDEDGEMGFGDDGEEDEDEENDDEGEEGYSEEDESEELEGDEELEEEAEDIPIADA